MIIYLVYSIKNGRELTEIFRHEDRARQFVEDNGGEDLWEIEDWVMRM